MFLLAQSSPCSSMAASPCCRPRAVSEVSIVSLRMLQILSCTACRGNSPCSVPAGLYVYVNAKRACLQMCSQQDRASEVKALDNLLSMLHWAHGFPMCLSHHTLHFWQLQCCADLHKTISKSLHKKPAGKPLTYQLHAYSCADPPAQSAQALVIRCS